MIYDIDLNSGLNTLCSVEDESRINGPYPVTHTDPEFGDRISLLLFCTPDSHVRAKVNRLHYRLDIEAILCEGDGTRKERQAGFSCPGGAYKDDFFAKSEDEQLDCYPEETRALLPAEVSVCCLRLNFYLYQLNTNVIPNSNLIINRIQSLTSFAQLLAS